MFNLLWRLFGWEGGKPLDVPCETYTVPAVVTEYRLRKLVTTVEIDELVTAYELEKLVSTIAVDELVTVYDVSCCEGGDTMPVAIHPRTEHDDYPISLDYSRVDFYADSPITAATVECDDADLVLGTPDVSVENVVTFNISGGAADTEYTVTVTTQNAEGKVLCRSVSVPTNPC